MKKLKDDVWFVAAEMAPLVKVGGLGDVVGSLPKELIKFGMSVKVVIPSYKRLRFSDFIQLEELLPPGKVMFGEIPFDFGIRKARTKSGIPLILVEQEHFFGRDDIYGSHGGASAYKDNLWRYSLLAHASVYAMKMLGAPRIVHTHDWSGGIVPAVIRQVFGDEPKSRPGIILTIHNLGYQGVYPIDDFYDIGIDYRFNSSLAYEHFGTFNALKGGMLLSDVVTTVSPTYAREITGQDMGFGLDGELRRIRDNGRLYGILNGIDEEYWDPSTDKFLPERLKGKPKVKGKETYTLRDYGRWKEFKEKNKTALFSEIGVKPSSNGQGSRFPLLGVVSRLTEEKGIDLFIDSLFNWWDFPFCAVILGSGKDVIEKKAVYLSNQFKDRVYVKINSYDEAFAHKIYAASDVFVMPSRTEPCGLSQMISMRYGDVVIAGNTGGLHDTISDITIDEEKANGILIKHMDINGILWAMQKINKLFHSGVHWKRLVINSVNKDFDWSLPALKYKELYDKIKS